MSSIKKERCFVITPIGDETDPIRRHIKGIIDAAIKPSIGDAYEIIVAHKISEPGSITKQVITEIYNSKLVIANLTNRNPNVMYELALRHAIGKPAIMIAEKGTPLPSDIIMQRTIFYQNDAKGVLELRDEIKKAEEEISFAEKCGPIYDVLGDISHDANLFKKVEATDNESTQLLEYILMRLNRIEDAIVYSRNQELSRQNEERFPLLRAMHFKYDLIDRKYSMKALKSMLSQVDRTDPNVHVRDIFVDTEKRVVSIYMHLSDFIDVPAAYDYFIKTLSGFGFYGAAPVVREG